MTATNSVVPKDDVTHTLSAPVDDGAYMLHSSNHSAKQLDAYLSAVRHRARSSEFLNNLLGDAGNLTAEAWRRLRR